MSHQKIFLIAAIFSLVTACGQEHAEVKTDRQEIAENDVRALGINPSKALEKALQYSKKYFTNHGATSVEQQVARATDQYSRRSYVKSTMETITGHLTLLGRGGHTHASGNQIGLLTSDLIKVETWMGIALRNGDDALHASLKKLHEQIMNAINYRQQVLSNRAIRTSTNYPPGNNPYAH